MMLAERHPAKYGDTVLQMLVDRLAPLRLSTIDSDGWVLPRVLDPFAGTGRIHRLDGTVARTVGVEIEPEWAAHDPRTIVGDATLLPFGDDTFDAVATSPCYGNRMADTYDGRDGSKRHTYRIDLGRMPTDGSAAVLQWGDDYRELHVDAIYEMRRVVRPGGLVLVNMSNHIRGGQEQYVVEWWLGALATHGFVVSAVLPVETRRLGHGANRAVRVSGERLIVGTRA